METLRQQLVNEVARKMKKMQFTNETFEECYQLALAQVIESRNKMYEQLQNNKQLIKQYL